MNTHAEIFEPNNPVIEAIRRSVTEDVIAKQILADILASPEAVARLRSYLAVLSALQEQGVQT